MPHLDTRGIISAVEIAFYTPIAFLTLYLVYRYAFRRDAGWLFLSIFSMGKFVNSCNIISLKLLNKCSSDSRRSLARSRGDATNQNTSIFCRVYHGPSSTNYAVIVNAWVSRDGVCSVAQVHVGCLSDTSWAEDNTLTANKAVLR